MIRYSRTFLITICLLLSGAAQAKFDPEPFQNGTMRSVLAFDLRNEAAIETGLIIRDDGPHVPDTLRIILPFTSNSSSGNDQISALWGSYSNNTYISVVLPGTGAAFYPIGITSNIRYLNDTSDLDRIGDTIIFSQSGQIRSFIYRYPQDRPNEGAVAAFMRSVSSNVDAVAIALPSDAQAVEVKAGQTSNPAALFYTSRHVGYFPANQQSGVDKLILKYYLPATEAQKTIIEFLTKTFAVGIVPFITIVTTKTVGQTLTTRRKRMIVIGGVILQTILLSTFIMLSIHWAGAMTSSNMIDVAIGVLGGLAQLVVWWVAG
jgi:hypothetical protein